jgi:exopolyphosphatase / guanosine-5'-triphosphate,3'-diphosphate pyrophosphatase
MSHVISRTARPAVEPDLPLSQALRLAAIDLGSNSFRLEIGKVDHGHILRSEYLKETVRQGNGLDENRCLTPDAMERGWACLARFGERLAGFQPKHVRAVATQTLREARNRDIFLARAQSILGFPIEVIPGPEEARLIYQGVAHLLPQSDERRLVIDIGGRSTELILGQRELAMEMASYRVGSVGWSMKYFPEGQLNAAAFERAEIAAKAVLDETFSTYNASHWDVAYGASGTVGAVGDVLNANGWPRDRITREGLAWLRERLLRAQHVDKLRLDGIKDDRRPVIGGGVSVLCALFDLLAIQELQVAAGALRHGLLYQMLAQHAGQDSDRRSQSVQSLALRFQTDALQSERVEKSARQLLTQLHPSQPSPQPSALECQLSWVAQLHEIGLAIAHSDYHKHGAYILDNADILGFSQQELHRLSLLLLGHRGKLRKLPIDFEDQGFVTQLLALRLAVILCHARQNPDLHGITLASIDATTHRIVMHCKPRWVLQHPQSMHLLREESLAWQKTGWHLLIGED